MLLEGTPRPDGARIGLDPDDVTRIVVGHGHWDHAGQLSAFPNAVLYIQKEELKQIDFFLDYPVDFNGGHIRAPSNTDRSDHRCAGRATGAGLREDPRVRLPAPDASRRSSARSCSGKAKIIDGRHQVAPGMIIHPAFRGHTYGSQLLQVNTPRGQLVFGSDTYSSWTGIRDWLVANIQQTDTIQQFLAYEKCYVLTSTSQDELPQLRRGPRADVVHARVSPHGQLVDSRRALLACRRADPGQRRAHARAAQPEPDAVRRQHRAGSSHHPVA